MKVNQNVTEQNLTKTNNSKREKECQSIWCSLPNDN